MCFYVKSIKISFHSICIEDYQEHNVHKNEFFFFIYLTQKIIFIFCWIENRFRKNKHTSIYPFIHSYSSSSIFIHCEIIRNILCVCWRKINEMKWDELKIMVSFNHKILPFYGRILLLLYKQSVCLAEEEFDRDARNR